MGRLPVLTGIEHSGVFRIRLRMEISCFILNGQTPVWDDQTVIFRPGANGKLLENGKRYMIHLAFAPAWMYHEISCECMDCSLYGNYEWTIGFITADE
jgi:hypothetical protein